MAPCTVPVVEADTYLTLPAACRATPVLGRVRDVQLNLCGLQLTLEVCCVLLRCTACSASCYAVLGLLQGAAGGQLLVDLRCDKSGVDRMLRTLWPSQRVIVSGLQAHASPLQEVQQQAIVQARWVQVRCRMAAVAAG